jgi:amino acid adenylation domain-containing protein
VPTLPDLLDASARLFPNRTAVVDSTGAALTYSELQARSDALAGYLNHCGVGRGDRVAVAILKSADAIVAQFGIMKAGAAYVPIDALGPLERGRGIVGDCEVSAAIVNARTAPMVSAAPAVPLIAVERVDAVGAVSFADVLSSGRPRPVVKYEADDRAYIIFTSGSTGVPKGAMITHANALSFLDWCSSEFRPGENDRFANYSPLHFDPSVFDVYLSVKHGASVHLVSEALAKRPADLAAFIAARRLSMWCSTPSALMMLATFADLSVQDCSSLRVVAFGGEVFPPRHLRELKQRWSAAAFYNLYGPTETTTACTFARIPDDVPHDRSAPYPIGMPCSHCRAMLLDEDGLPVPEGSDGLLYISGPSVFAGYWKRRAETEATMTERDGIRWYNTGDIVRWHAREGYTYVGRKDGMVKRRGFRIEVGEIERTLYLHPNVSEAAVVAVPDPDSSVRLAAFLAWKGAAPSTVELKTFCARTLPAYMSPDLFIVVDRLPRTSTDKVDVRALKSQVLHASVG